MAVYLFPRSVRAAGFINLGTFSASFSHTLPFARSGRRRLDKACDVLSKGVGESDMFLDNLGERGTCMGARVWFIYFRACSSSLLGSNARQGRSVSYLCTGIS